MFLGSAFLVKGTNGGSFLLSASTAKLLIGARRLHAHTFRALRFDPGASGHINVYGRLVRVADLGQKKLFFTPELNREVMKIVRALSLPSAGNSWNTVELLQRHSPFRCMNRIVQPLLALKIETGIPVASGSDRLHFRASLCTPKLLFPHREGNFSSLGPQNA